MAFLLKFLIYNFPTASKNGQRLSKRQILLYSKHRVKTVFWTPWISASAVLSLIYKLFPSQNTTAHSDHVVSTKKTKYLTKLKQIIDRTDL